MKIGFIGCGNMGKAMIHGMIDSGKCAASDITASVKTEKSAEECRNDLGINVTTDNISVVRSADVLFLAVKPQFFEEVIGQIKDEIADNVIIVSIAPGKTLSWFDEKFKRE